ncbi:hypothetical protein ACRAVF_33940 (plasmid) [Bradyrhizobium oligotrophicum S58]
MRFKRYIDHSFEDTRRKRLALARSQRMQRDRLPLFAELIAENQPSADVEMERRAADWIEWTKRDRARRARDWRRARAKLAGYGDNVRRALLNYWNRCRWPADPSYLLSMMHMFDTGHLDISYVPRPFGESAA